MAGRGGSPTRLRAQLLRLFADLQGSRRYVGSRSRAPRLYALGRVDDYANKVVYRHEQTLSKPKADRLNLLQTTRVNRELIFMVYSDPADKVGKILHQDGPPTIELRDEYGVLHRVWKVSDPQTVAAAKAQWPTRSSSSPTAIIASRPL